MTCHDVSTVDWHYWEQIVTNICAAHGHLGDQPFEEHQMLLAKRFSAAELAAEYWRARTGTRLRVYQRDEDGNILDVYGPGWEYEYDVLERFATLPHYDEEDDDGL